MNRSYPNELSWIDKIPCLSMDNENKKIQFHENYAQHQVDIYIEM